MTTNDEEIYPVTWFSIEQIIYIKMDLALNNLQRLICHKTQQTKPNRSRFELR